MPGRSHPFQLVPVVSNLFKMDLNPSSHLCALLPSVPYRVRDQKGSPQMVRHCAYLDMRLQNHVDLQRQPVFPFIEPSICVAEKPINLDSRIAKLLHELIHTILNFKKISMVATLRLRHRQWYSCVIGKIERVCCPCFLSSLILNAFSTPFRWRMGPIYMIGGKVQQTFVALKQFGVYRQPIAILAPFPEMMENSVVTWLLTSGEELLYGEKKPPTSSFELVNDGLGYFLKVKFADKSSFATLR